MPDIIIDIDQDKLKQDSIQSYVQLIQTYPQYYQKTMEQLQTVIDQQQQIMKEHRAKEQCNTIGWMLGFVICLGFQAMPLTTEKSGIGYAAMAGSLSGLLASVSFLGKCAYEQVKTKEAENKIQVVTDVINKIKSIAVFRNTLPEIPGIAEALTQSADNQAQQSTFQRASQFCGRLFHRQSSYETERPLEEQAPLLRLRS